MSEFLKFVFTPAGHSDAGLAVAACRAGAVGVVDAELTAAPAALAPQLGAVASFGRGAFGVRLGLGHGDARAILESYFRRGLRWLIVDADMASRYASDWAAWRQEGLAVVVETSAPRWIDNDLSAAVDGLLLKGNEAGGFVGEDSSFILLQKWLGKTALPIYVRGGVTPHVAAACRAVGVAGIVLDSQLLLLQEAGLSESVRTLLGNLAGNETVAVGDGEHGEYFRVLNRPGHQSARDFIAAGDGIGADALRALVSGRVDWNNPKTGLLPIGQDICFAAPWRKAHRHLAEILAVFDRTCDESLQAAVRSPAVVEGAPLARALGIRYPIVQGPMTRVSDVAEFAQAVSEGGALPMVAFALLKGKPLSTLLKRTTELLADRPWGIGLLGFAPQSLLDEQLAAAMRFKPNFAIIAGGRPDQVERLEQVGVPSFLHVPSANLIGLFLQEGARRFIFEGRECGGHIGPLSSFVLWSTMVDRLLDELVTKKVPADQIQLVFAGGIHDAVSSAMVQVLVAPLVAQGVKVGILMGSAYLFTKEIVASGAIVPRFQQEVIDCGRTVNLESGPGHASRCGYTPFAQEFFRKRVEMRANNVPADESRRVLDDLILGRLRIASKGRNRDAEGRMHTLSKGEQHAQGMYMLGQVATLRDAVTEIAELHREVTDDAAALLAGRRAALASMPALPSGAIDIAIIGMASVLPKSGTTREYWQNILDRVDAITEIPSHRWDWRLYFDPDRTARDKIYSKWGGFLDDLAFDPTQYGMPPKSIEAVDPMQLIALEVAHRTLVDAGYHDKAFDRERASVIIGASGGTGDVGTQYGLRAELPRFTGQLPGDVADRLPEWTEDSFAGILLNVIAGRIANRLNFGGVNFTTDAACGASLAAVYQGVTELAAGRSDLVITGGVDTVQGPFGYLCFSKTQALSPRGRCSTFDAEADGIVISEGIAMVALKRLADAERDGDRIYGVIKGVGGSSDGGAKGLTAPLPAGQLRAMRRAYAMAGFGPSSVGLFEAHGTGTVAGDTAELESTTQLIREEGSAPRRAVIGSVKTMIGHTKATAGVAGLIKATLALHHRVLPPHLNVKTPNRVLADPSSPLYLVDEATPWIAPGDVPRRAACSAFGFGGTNFHVVLEEYTREYRDWLRPATADLWPAELLVWSDANRAGLLARVETLQGQLGALETLALRDLAASLAARWSARGETLAIVARNVGDLRPKLEAALGFLRGETKSLPRGVYHGTTPQAPGKLAVLFPGQGSQYPGMAREIALHFEPVARAMGDADAALREAFGARFGTGARLSQFILPRGAYGEAAKDAARKALTSTDVAQPALGAVEVGLFKLMQSLGLKADMLAGHSYGEFVALWAAGAIDFDALMQLSAARGRFIVDAASAEGAELGTMAAVQAPRKVVEDAIADIDGVIIANHNAPLQSIVSGTREAVKAASANLSKAGVEVVEIPVAAAFHSSLVEPAKQALSDLIDAMPWAPLSTPVYSNTTARPHATDVDRVKRQMAEHLVRPIEFVAEVAAMYRDGARVFVEVGPKAVLTRLTSKILDGQPHMAVAIDDGTGLPGLLCGIAQLLCAGVTLDLSALFARRDCRVGDPVDAAALLRISPVAKHAWMLNGSGARRATESVQQIGVTLEQAQAVPPAPVPAAPTVAAAGAPAQSAMGAAALAAAAPTAFVPSRFLRRGRPMDDRRTGMADSSMMSEYFETMRKFLETQERVMSSFLGDGVTMARPALRSRTARLTVPRMAEVAPAPMATPVAMPVAAPAPAPASVMPMAAPGSAPVAAAPALQPVPGDAMTREKMVDMLLGIVEEKTGYPCDMVGLDQNLESDLGIDSIKRVEVVGTLLQMLPAAHREALTDSRSKLNTQPTLNGMLDLVAQAAVGGAVTVPFDPAGVGAQVDAVNHPLRHVMRPVAEPVPVDAARTLVAGTFVLTRDVLGVADALAARLTGRGATVRFVDVAALANEPALVDWCARQRASVPQWSGIVHLAALGSPTLTADAIPADARALLWQNEKSIFVLMREFSVVLKDDAHLLAASGLGGLFGREGSATDALQLQGGCVGALKSLREERPRLRVKAVDVDPSRRTADIADDLLNELTLDGGRQEVGYPSGSRTVFCTVAEAAVADPLRAQELKDLVVVATGGARGITAEVLREELARTGNTLVLVGRSTLPEVEPLELSALTDADALRQHFIAQVRSGTSKLKPGEIERHVRALLGLREMRLNIADFRDQGATVEYHAVDVTDAAAVGALLADVRQRHGRIDGVVHGAGVIEDKQLADKTSDSWSRVVDTKVIGLLLLQKFVAPGSLKFFTVFSSVAGRFGNSGQSDYATANELMNRLCTALQARWGTTVAVSALCWGPWGPTKFGAGMVTAETEAKFAEKGVLLVSAEQGRSLFHRELARTDGTPVEVICGAGPWEAREIEVGGIRRALAEDAGPSLAPMLGPTRAQAHPTGEQTVAVRLDPLHHVFLQDHAFDGQMVLPAAAALEMLAEAAQAMWPGWRVVEVHEFKLIKGVDLKAGTRLLQVLISPPPYGSRDGFEVTASLQSELAPGRMMNHYRAVVRFEQQWPHPPPAERRAHREKTISVSKAYNEWLCHGPRFQLMESFTGFSQQGSGAIVRSTRPAEWLARGNDAAGWVFDPGLLDAAAQMAWVWARAFRNETTLPARFGRVVRYRERLPERVHMEFERIETPDPSLVRASVYFLDDNGECVMLVEELDSVGSAALNRIGGQAARRAAGAVT